MITPEDLDKLTAAAAHLEDLARAQGADPELLTGIHYLGALAVLYGMDEAMRLTEEIEEYARSTDRYPQPRDPAA